MKSSFQPTLKTSHETIVDPITQEAEFLAAVAEGEKQADRGELVPHEQVKEEFQKSFTASLAEQLKRLHRLAHELCGAIEELPASERQTSLSLQASAVSQVIQGWWQQEVATVTSADRDRPAGDRQPPHQQPPAPVEERLPQGGA